jgi:NADPH:quinone reductase-like Zn-dependent oxidoreductase
MAGTIVAIGRDVRGFAVGDKVFGLAPGVANYTLAEINRITNVPQGANVQDYGIVGLAGTVANQILTKHWFDRPDYTVRNMLVIGASGGVGSSLVQIARAAGGPELTIYGVTSGKNMAYVKEIGASQAIDYTTPNFDLGRVLPIHSVDLIVDVVSGVAEGPTYVDRGMPLLKQSGRYVALNSTSSFDWFRAYLTDKCGCNMRRSK